MGRGDGGAGGRLDNDLGSLSHLDRNPCRKDGRRSLPSWVRWPCSPSARTCPRRLRSSILPMAGSTRSRSSRRSVRSLPRPAHRSSHGSTALFQAFDNSKWLAGEMLGLAERLISDVRELSESINMRFLYDPERKLFAIGFNVSDGPAGQRLLRSPGQRGADRKLRRHCPGGSPAGALVLHGPALRRDRPAAGAAELDRDHVRIPDAAPSPALLRQARSWTRRPGKRWRSRSPTAASFACPGASRSPPSRIWTSTRPINTRPSACRSSGLKRGQEERAGRRPLCQPAGGGLAPRETVQNLKRLAGLGLLGDYGYYEAMDFSRQPSREQGGQARGDRRGVHGPSPGHGVPVADQLPPWQSRPAPFPCRPAGARRRAPAPGEHPDPSAAVP